VHLIKLSHENVCDVVAALGIIDKIRSGKIPIDKAIFNSYAIFCATECFPETKEIFDKEMETVPSFDY